MSSTASENGGHILKLQSKQDKVQETVFGTTTQKSQETYYLKVGAPVAVGTVGDIDISKFKVTELPYVLPEGNENAGQTVMLKWLFL